MFHSYVPLIMNSAEIYFVVYLFLVGSGNRFAYLFLLLISGDNGGGRGAYDA